MGHRALLAYRREADDDSLDAEADASDADSEGDFADQQDDAGDARYDLHRSHWGGADFALCEAISADAPFAADISFAVDPDPVATDRSLAEIVTNYLDFLHHEAFYRVGPDFETTAYHVLWFGLEADSETVERSETVGHGALVEAVSADADSPADADFSADDEYLRGWFRGTKAAVGEMVDRETLDLEGAADYLAERVTLWADDREVILPD